jgi:uncharacterized protein YjbI with pentapeptide repeats
MNVEKKRKKRLCTMNLSLFSQRDTAGKLPRLGYCMSAASREKQDADLSRINLGSSIGLNTSSPSIYGPSATGEPNGCNLSGINLQGADLKDASFKNAYLGNAYLGGADLSGANLTGAFGTTSEQLKKAKSLHGTIMPDRTIHP